MLHNIAVRGYNDLLNEIKKLHLNISETVRRSLFDEVTRRKNDLIQDDLLELEKLLSKENPDDYIRLVRQTRDEW